MYSPLRHFGLDKKGMKLGVVGLGGLGHMCAPCSNPKAESNHSWFRGLGMNLSVVGLGLGHMRARYLAVVGPPLHIMAYLSHGSNVSKVASNTPAAGWCPLCKTSGAFD